MRTKLSKMGWRFLDTLADGIILTGVPDPLVNELWMCDVPLIEGRADHGGFVLTAAGTSALAEK